MTGMMPRREVAELYAPNVHPDRQCDKCGVVLCRDEDVRCDQCSEEDEPRPASRRNPGPCQREVSHACAIEGVSVLRGCCDHRSTRRG